MNKTISAEEKPSEIFFFLNAERKKCLSADRLQGTCFDS